MKPHKCDNLLFFVICLLLNVSGFLTVHLKFFWVFVLIFQQFIAKRFTNNEKKHDLKPYINTQLGWKTISTFIDQAKQLSHGFAMTLIETNKHLCCQISWIVANTDRQPQKNEKESCHIPHIKTCLEGSNMRIMKHRDI